MGKKSEIYSCFLVETGVDGTIAFRGGTLNFYGAGAVNKTRVSAVRGGLEKDSWDAQGHEATDTGLAYAPVSQAHGDHHIVQCFALLHCSADQF